MHTKCPTCQSLFRINIEQLQQAQGRVRCGQCKTHFDAQNNIVLPKGREMLTDLRAPIDAQLSANEKRPAPSRPTPVADKALEQEDIPLPKLIPESDKGAPRQQFAVNRAVTNSSGGVSEKTDIGINNETNYSPRREAFALVLSSVALILLLLAQFVYFYIDHLSKQPLLASFIEDACDMIGCVIEPIRDTDRIEVINRNVFSHPSVENALMITATFANVAPFPQPYPIMQVSLTDLQGKTVAARRFLPNEYLENVRESPHLMKPGMPVDVSVEVLDPQNGAMAFEFSFLDRRG
jgi:predicted Zn finger-like uncharacterized protein